MVKNIIAFEDDGALRQQLEKIFFPIRQEFHLINTFPDARQVLEHVKTYKPEAVLMDIQMLDDDDGLVALYQIKQHFPEVKVMMLTMFDNDDKIFNAICLRADGYMLKSDFSSAQIPHEAIRKSLNIIFNNGAYLTPTVAKQILKLYQDETIGDKIKNVKKRFKEIIHKLNNPTTKEMAYQLTKTQIIILQKLVEGKTSAEIAAERFIETAPKRAKREQKKKEKLAEGDTYKEPVPSEDTVNTHIQLIYQKLGVHNRAKAITKAIEEKLVKFHH
jgi:DNA-binding NarL/FixJ family response regulator